MLERLELTTAEQVKAALHPIRKRILDSLERQGKATPSEVARAIGLPANKVHYHMNILEKNGLVRLVETRRVGAVTEKYFSLVAAELILRPRDHEGQMEAAMPLIELELRAMLQDLRARIARGEEQEVRDVATLTMLRLSADEHVEAEVRRALEPLLKRVAQARERTPGREYRLIVGWVPVDAEPEIEGDG